MGELAFGCKLPAFSYNIEPPKSYFIYKQTPKMNVVHSKAMFITIIVWNSTYHHAIGLTDKGCKGEGKRCIG